MEITVIVQESCKFKIHNHIIFFPQKNFLQGVGVIIFWPYTFFTELFLNKLVN